MVSRKNPRNSYTKKVLDPVTQYAQEVVSGKEMAGPLVRLACQRHLTDLIEGPKRGLKWEWTLSDGSSPRGTGKYVADFFAEELLLKEDKPFVLAPPLLFIVGSLFGWKGPDGFRRFRVSYTEIGKGNAKTSVAGGLGLYMMLVDGEYRAECYTAACDKDQAKIPFRDAVSFVNLNPRLNGAIRRSGGEDREYNLAYLKTGSFLRPTASESSGKGKSGFRPHLVVLDEIHEHPTSAMVDLSIANLKTRTQPLVFMITNSGIVDPGAVCYQWHEHGDRMLRGLDANDDSQFFYICGLDKGDSYLDPAIRKKGNPMLGVIPGMDRYLDDCNAAAKGMPSKISITRRLNYCEWVESADPWVTKEVWDLNDAPVNLEALKGRTCYGAMDLSKILDLTVLVLIFPDEEAIAWRNANEEDRKVLPRGIKDVVVFAWTPETGLKDREHWDKAPYSQWVREGILLTTPGKTIDYSFIAAKLGELTKLYDFEVMAFDHWHFDEMERELNEIDVELNVVDHQQGFIGMNPAIEAAEQDMINGRLRHGGNPLLTTAVFNCKIEKNPAALRAFEKRKATGRIDAAVALAMGVNVSVSMAISSRASYRSVLI